MDDFLIDRVFSNNINDKYQYYSYPLIVNIKHNYFQFSAGIKSCFLTLGLHIFVYTQIIYWIYLLDVDYFYAFF